VHNGELLKKKTQPPSRYTKASLIKEMERRGIGRPSTFASILKNITSKGMIEEKSRKLVPAPLGEETIAKLEGFYSFRGARFYEGAGAGFGQSRPGPRHLWSCRCASA